MEIKIISPGEALVKLQEKNIFLVDVRTPYEWQIAGVPDLSRYNKTLRKITINNNEKEFSDLLEEEISGRNSHIIFICRSGVRSAYAAALAQQAGYKNTYNVAGGFENWKASELPWHFEEKY